MLPEEELKPVELEQQTWGELLSLAAPMVLDDLHQFHTGLRSYIGLRSVFFGRASATFVLGANESRLLGTTTSSLSLIEGFKGLLLVTRILSLVVTWCRSFWRSVIVCVEVPFEAQRAEVGLLLPALLTESCGRTSSEAPGGPLASMREEGTRGRVPKVAEVRRSL